MMRMGLEVAKNFNPWSNVFLFFCKSSCGVDEIVGAAIYHDVMTTFPLYGPHGIIVGKVNIICTGGSVVAHNENPESCIGHYIYGDNVINMRTSGMLNPTTLAACSVLGRVNLKESSLAVFQGNHQTMIGTVHQFTDTSQYIALTLVAAIGAQNQYIKEHFVDLRVVLKNGQINELGSPNSIPIPAYVQQRLARPTPLFQTPQIKPLLDERNAGAMLVDPSAKTPGGSSLDPLFVLKGTDWLNVDEILPHGSSIINKQGQRELAPRAQAEDIAAAFKPLADTLSNIQDAIVKSSAKDVELFKRSFEDRIVSFESQVHEKIKESEEKQNQAMTRFAGEITQSVQSYRQESKDQLEAYTRNIKEQFDEHKVETRNIVKTAFEDMEKKSEDRHAIIDSGLKATAAFSGNLVKVFSEFTQEQKEENKKRDLQFTALTQFLKESTHSVRGGRDRSRSRRRDRSPSRRRDRSPSRRRDRSLSRRRDRSLSRRRDRSNSSDRSRTSSSDRGRSRSRR